MVFSPTVWIFLIEFFSQRFFHEGVWAHPYMCWASALCVVCDKRLLCCSVSVSLLYVWWCVRLMQAYTTVPNQFSIGVVRGRRKEGLL